MKRSNELNPNNPNCRYQKWNPSAAPSNKPPQQQSPINNGFQQMKKQHEPFSQNANKPSPAFQRANKTQRVNQMDESNDSCSVNCDSMDNNYDCETVGEQQSTEANEESIFLDE